MKVVLTLDRFDEVEREAKQILRRVLSDAAAETQGMAQMLAPVDTGRLRAGISMRDSGPLSFEVYTNIEYAPYQEFGTRYQAGTPHMRPAYERTLPRVRARIAQEMLTL